MKALLDHNMPPRLARGLHAIVSADGHEVFALRDRFDVQVTDAEYFTRLGKEPGWIVISKDTANARKPVERLAILRSGVLAFYLAPAVQRLPISQQAATLLWQWNKLVSQRETTENGLFQLPLNKGSRFRSL